MVGEILTPRELSKKLKIPLPSIYCMVSRKQIPYFKIGGRLRFNQDEVLAHFMKVPSDIK